MSLSDLNLIDVDKVVIDHEVKSEKEQNSLQQFKEKIGSYFSSTNKETELEEFNETIDLIKLPSQNQLIVNIILISVKNIRGLECHGHTRRKNYCLAL